MKDSDEHIIDLLLSKSYQNKGMSLLMNRYSKILYPVINGITRNSTDTYDVLQETYIKVFSKIKTYSKEASFFTWIYRIAVNEALQYLRMKKKKLDVHPFEKGIHQTAYEPGDSEEKIWKKLYQAIQHLPEKQQLVFTLRYFNEMDYKTMSNLLLITEGSLKASYHHALKKIENSLLNH
ncbi:MAG: RNA polymerase sigma factor [Saprospiraceae bacterium]